MPPTWKQHPSARTKAKAPSTTHSSSIRSSHNSLPTIPETSDQLSPTEPADVQDHNEATHATPDQRRRSKRTNAGTGGHLKQLEKIGQAIEESPLPRPRVVLPDNEPINRMAPIPRRTRKKVHKPLANADLETLSATPASANQEHGVVVQPVQVAVQSDQGSRFGFQLKAPPLPTFVGSETLDTFEHHQMTSRNTTKAPTTLTPKSQGPRGASAPISRLNQHSPVAPRHKSQRANSKPCTIASRQSSACPQVASSPLSSPHEREAKSSPRQSNDSREGSDCEKELHSRRSKSEKEEEPPSPRHIAQGKGIVLPKSDDINNCNDQYHNDNGDHQYGDYQDGTDQYYYDNEDGGTGQYNSDDNNNDLYGDHDNNAHSDGRIPDKHAKHIDKTIHASPRASVPPQTSNVQQETRMPPPIQPSGAQTRSLSSGTQIHSLSSHSRQAPTQPLDVQESYSQKQTTTLPNPQKQTSSNQRRDAQKRMTASANCQTDPQAPRPPSQVSKGRSHPQALPTPPISCSNLGAATDPGEREEHSHRMGDERVGVKYDLLKRHHTTNCRQRSPSLRYLEGVCNGEDYQRSKRRRGTASKVDAIDVDEDIQVEDGEDNEERMDVDDRLHNEGEADAKGGEEDAASPNEHGKKKSGRYSKNPKGSVAAKPTTISFYPELWHKLLNLAKARMRLHVAVEDGFPKLEIAVDHQCREVLDEVIAHFETNKWEVERGIYPRYKAPMSRLIFNDTQTFHSDIKKAVVKYICPGYDLSLPSTAKTNEEYLTAVMNKAGHLLSTSLYLHGEPDELGKASNFALRVLKDTVLDFFYNSSSKSLRQFPEFQDAVPYRALLLVAGMIHALLCPFRTYGFIDEKTVKLNAQNVEVAYDELTAQMEAILQDPYHGPKLDRMLSNWARTGMTGYTKKPKPAASTCNKFAVVLD